MIGQYPAVYRFETRMTRAEMLAALNAAGPWTWRSCGDELVASTGTRIAAVGCGFAVSVDSGAAEPIVREVVLVAVAARTIAVPLHGPQGIPIDQYQ